MLSGNLVGFQQKIMISSDMYGGSMPYFVSQISGQHNNDMTIFFFSDIHQKPNKTSCSSIFNG